LETRTEREIKLMTSNQVELQDQIVSNVTRPIAQSSLRSSITHFHSCTRTFCPLRLSFPRHTVFRFVFCFAFSVWIVLSTITRHHPRHFPRPLPLLSSHSIPSMKLSITQHTHTSTHACGRKENIGDKSRGKGNGSEKRQMGR